MVHDLKCFVARQGGSCCPWMGECECQCSCDYIKEIREDTLHQAMQAFQSRTLSGNTLTFSDAVQVLETLTSEGT